MKKKFFSLFTAVVLSSSIFIACNNEAETKTAKDSTTVSKEEPMAPPAEAPKDIVDVAAASADHSTLVAAVKAAGLVETLKEIEDNIGIKSVKLIHLNDALGTLGSRVDRHNHIGKGNIGLEGMKRISNHPKLKNIPMILETPKDTPKSDRINLNLVRSLAKAG